MKPPASIRLVLTGPESSGKSALTAHLGAFLGVPYALEYARIFLEKHGPSYDYDLLLEISRKHAIYQQAMAPADEPAGILDTDLINFKIWCEVAYGRCHPEIVAGLNRETHHVYLLCFPDLPWAPDPLREHPTQRMMLFERHRAEIERTGRRYEVIRGIGADRYRAAEAAARRLLAGEAAQGDTPRDP